MAAKFVGTEPREIMEKIKKTFGSDCVIFHTATRQRKILWLFKSKPVYEVIAGPGQDKKTPLKQDVQSASSDVTSIQNDIRELKRVITEKMTAGSDPLVEEMKEYVHENLASKIAGIIGAHRNGAPIPEIAVQAISGFIDRCVPVIGTILVQPPKYTWAFVGPTGSGKTTTIAKIAALLKYKMRKSVSVVTTDVYRIGADEQIRKACDLMEIPVNVAFNPEELKTKIDSTVSDVILIDTPGICFRDRVKMPELKVLLEYAKPSRVSSVMQSNIDVQSMLQIAGCFNELPCTDFIFTKSDETTKFGNILSVVSEIQKPISFVCNGQKIPSDIQVATTASIKSLVMAE